MEQNWGPEIDLHIYDQLIYMIKKNEIKAVKERT